jgi:acetyl esterase/lipase
MYRWNFIPVTNFFVCCFVCLSLATTALVEQLVAQEPQSLKIWNDSVPGLADGEKQEIVVEQDERIGQRVTKVTAPTITIYRPEKKTSDAVMIVCPGGGYHILALDLEGTEVANWLNDLGMTAIVLQYRVPKGSDTQFRLPLMDAQRTISLVRQHAKEWELNPEQIGIMGFSAGGHLAANAATNFSQRAYDPIDEADQQSCRPNFFMLVYPAYLAPKETAKGEAMQLFDGFPISAETPPGLMIHAADDNVTCNSSIAMFMALREAKIPAELHIYPDGGHGYGLRPSDHAVSTWPDRAATWLKGLKLFKE